MAEMPDYLRACEEGLLLLVSVRPGSSRRRLEAPRRGRLAIAVRSPAEGGKANREALELLSQVLGIPLSRIAMVTGSRSGNKTILIRGLSKGDAGYISRLLHGG